MKSKVQNLLKIKYQVLNKTYQVITHYEISFSIDNNVILGHDSVFLDTPFKVQNLTQEQFKKICALEYNVNISFYLIFYFILISIKFLQEFFLNIL